MKPPRWLDGLRGRIAAVLLVALLTQFVGGEILFNEWDQRQVEGTRSRRLAERVAISETLVTQPADLARVTALWRPQFTIALHGAPPAAGPTSDALAVLREHMIAEQPTLAARQLRLRRDGDGLRGAVRLDDGRWLSFDARAFYVIRDIPVFHYVSTVVLLIACVALIALLFGRMVGRPLRQLVAAADRVGRDEPVSFTIEGPREVRRVAAAFEAMQARLLAHVREREQSLAVMSHDLRTPLARMRLNTAMIGDAEAARTIAADVTEMEAFVASVLDYLRGDEAEAEQRADIASILMTVVDEALDAGHAAEYRGPDRFETMTRPLKLKRVVRNIVENATRHAGNARVTLTAGNDALQIVVDDDGPGIAAAEIETAFQPFVRIPSTTGRRSDGAGLGLASARRLVARLGGTIMLLNRAEGGLRVVIALPG